MDPGSFPLLKGGASRDLSATRLPQLRQFSFQSRDPLVFLCKAALDIGSLETTNRTEQWPAEVSARLSERLAGLSDGAVTVQVDGRRATLEGTVRTRAEADRLKHLAEFEPGVDEVIDQLRVEQPSEK